MTNPRRSTHGTYAAGVLFAALVAALTVILAPVMAPIQHGAGGSVHAKNSETPGWMLELESQTARQQPVEIERKEPSFWI